MLKGTPNLSNGFFIEAGAYDGVKFSNSLLFEMRCVMALHGETSGCSLDLVGIKAEDTVQYKGHILKLNFCFDVN